MKYDIKDFEAVASGKVDVKSMCDFYGVSHKAFVLAMNRNGFYLRKTKIKIKTPNQTKVVSSISECAYELKVSDETIRNCLKGKRIKLFDDMGITIEVLKND